MGDDGRGPQLELLLTRLRFAVATHAAAEAGEPGVEPLPDFKGQLQVRPLSRSSFNAFILLRCLQRDVPVIQRL